MTGTGVVVPPQACTITVNPTSLAFGNVNVGANAARSTTVTNTGTAACALTVARTGTTEFGPHDAHHHQRGYRRNGYRLSDLHPDRSRRRHW